jgi:hypothetical protein
MSEVKVNKITPTTDCGTVTLGDSGDTVAIPAGVTLTSGGALQNSGTITNTGSITGVAITGTIDNQVNWQTTVKTTGFTATAGEGYFCDTTSAAFTVTLPASPSAGDLVGIKDYANTADTNNITIGRNGSNIEGVANDFVIEVEGGSITLIYVDATKGWLSTAAAKASDISEERLFITATGGTITTSGNDKIHTFTGPGTFCVSQISNCASENVVSYTVIAGGGSGGGHGGGGGAGGYREVKSPTTPYTASPLDGYPSSPNRVTITATAFPITVGGGGAAVNQGNLGIDGSNSVFSTITSAGGGGAGGDDSAGSVGRNGGSGGGAGYSGNSKSGGTGNTPPVSPPQGNNGGTNVASPNYGAGGGGAAGAVGGNGTPSTSGSGGAGTTSSITASPVTRAGGGGGTGNGPLTQGSGGSGGGGNGGPNGVNGTAGTANTGGGGGASGGTTPCTGIYSGAGGSGIVVIRYKFQ